MQRIMGRVSHLQVTRLAESETTGDITHSVRFWDGEALRVLEGAVTLEREGVRLCLDMGRGKKYRFRKLGT